MFRAMITDLLGPRLIAIAGTRQPDVIIGDVPDEYLRRWHLIPRNRWFNVYLHQFMRSDDDRALHDHPWWNASVLLRGSYIEMRPQGQRVVVEGSIVLRGAKSLHRVILFGGRKNAAGRTANENVVWTLFITGPRIREWGFACPKGWKHWKDFVSQREGGNSVGLDCD